MTNETTPEVLDVVVIGAGLSGIGAGYRLSERMPDLKYAILERRPSLGGTWDLFRYPGIRSDSDMYTLCYPFEPWQHERAIAAGGDILDYIKHTATKYGIEEHIRYEHEVVRADWSSEDALWTLTVRTADGEQEVRTRFVYACSGYYSYEEGYTPAKQLIEDSEALQDVTAVKEGQVVFAPADTYTNEGIQTFTEFFQDFADALEGKKS